MFKFFKKRTNLIVLSLFLSLYNTNSQSKNNLTNNNNNIDNFLRNEKIIQIIEEPMNSIYIYAGNDDFFRLLNLINNEIILKKYFNNNFKKDIGEIINNLNIKDFKSLETILENILNNKNFNQRYQNLFRSLYDTYNYLGKNINNDLNLNSIKIENNDTLIIKDYLKIYNDKYIDEIINNTSNDYSKYKKIILILFITTLIYLIGMKFKMNYTFKKNIKKNNIETLFENEIKETINENIRRDQEEQERKKQEEIRRREQEEQERREQEKIRRRDQEEQERKKQEEIRRRDQEEQERKKQEEIRRRDQEEQERKKQEKIRRRDQEEQERKKQEGIRRRDQEEQERREQEKIRRRDQEEQERKKQEEIRRRDQEEQERREQEKIRRRDQEEQERKKQEEIRRRDQEEQERREQEKIRRRDQDEQERKNQENQKEIIENYELDLICNDKTSRLIILSSINYLKRSPINDNTIKYWLIKYQSKGNDIYFFKPENKEKIAIISNEAKIIINYIIKKILCLKKYKNIDDTYFPCEEKIKNLFENTKKIENYFK